MSRASAQFLQVTIQHEVLRQLLVQSRQEMLPFVAQHNSQIRRLAQLVVTIWLESMHFYL